MSASQWRAAGIAVAVVLAASACGSTVAGTGASGVAPGGSGLTAAGNATTGAPGTGTAPGATTVGGASLGAAGTTGAAGVAAGSGPVNQSGGTGGGGSTYAGGAGARSLPVGPGVTATTINVGIIYESRNTDAGAQFGAKGLVKGDLRAEQQAIIDYINGSGGVAGRKLNPVAYDATTSSDAQSVCSYWTQDHKVFAGVYPGGQVPSDVGSSCLAKAHALWITAPFVPGDQAYMNKFAPYYYTPGSLEAIRMGKDYVDGLAAQGFFGQGHKVGLLYYDVPALQHALHQGVEPALAAHGVKLAVPPYSITYAASDSQDAAAVSAVQSAELKFAQAGIDRVMFLDAGAGCAFFFMQNAQTQHYHPKYGLETGSNPSFLEQQNFASDQLPGAIGVGWKPADDVALENIPDSPARKLCRQIMAAKGQTATAENDLLIQYDMCSSFFFLRDAINAAGVPNASAVQSALGALGNLPDASADSFGDGYSPQKVWGALYYEQLAFTTSCQCFRYFGSRVHV